MNATESVVEDAALEWFGASGFSIGHGPEMAPGELESERATFGDVVLIDRLRRAIWSLKPAIPEEAREEALRKVLRVATLSLIGSNRVFHKLLSGELGVAGVDRIRETAR